MPTATAALLRSAGAPLELAEITVDLPRSKEVLVRTSACGLCHSDLHFVDGSYRHALPVVLGHEAAGVVEAVGPDVDYVAVGDHVVTCLAAFCGACEYCLTGRQSLCEAHGLSRDAGAHPRLSVGGETVNQFVNVSGFSELMLVHEHALVKIRPDVALDRAALLGCAVVTGLGAVFNSAKVEVGQSVAVVGCGGVGLNCIQGAYLAGASRIVAVDLSSRALELAGSLGATDLVDAGDTDSAKVVRELTGGGVDHAFEAIGMKQTAEMAFAMLRRGGTATLIGMQRPGTTLSVPGRFVLGEMRVQGSFMGSTRFRVDIPRYLELYCAGRLKLDEIVTSTIALAEVNTGLAGLRDGTLARTVIGFD